MQLQQAADRRGPRYHLLDGNPPFPVDRQPKVAWYRVIGFVAGNTANHLLLEFVAASADMNQPTYTWSVSAPGANAIPLGDSRIAQVTFSFSHQLTIGQPLGTLTVSVTDADHHGIAAATYSAPLVVNRGYAACACA